MAEEALLKVIAGLECCRDAENMGCDVCPYDDGQCDSGDCINSLMEDALVILREVEQHGLY